MPWSWLRADPRLLLADGKVGLGDHDDLRVPVLLGALDVSPPARYGSADQNGGAEVRILVEVVQEVIDERGERRLGVALPPALAFHEQPDGEGVGAPALVR